MTTQPPSARLPPGTVVDQFRILRVLGTGGSGSVYLARDLTLGRKVALKFLHRAGAFAPDALERFLNEARTTAQFSHPNIVALHSVGRFEAQPYLALEYVQGRLLSDRLRESLPGTREALRITLAVAEALREAHRHRILHLDLKPANVILSEDGRPRVLDFGVARVFGPPVPAQEGDPDEGPELLETGARRHRSWLEGTPPYMAPEQWTSGEVCEATDVWALGVLLFQMLVGRRPYEGSMGSVGLAVMADDPAPRLSTDSVPETVADLVARCLRKRSVERPGVEAIVRRLHELLSDEQRPRDGDSEAPFRGLLPFDERHAGQFFGRDDEIAAFVERLRGEAVLPVVGPSGAGKSSFVRAGVIPRLREQRPWVVLHLQPGDRPFHMLATRVLQARMTDSTSGSLRRPAAGGYEPQARTPVVDVATVSQRFTPKRDGDTPLELPVSGPQPADESGAQVASPGSRRKTATEDDEERLPGGMDDVGLLASRLQGNPRVLAVHLLALAELHDAQVLLVIDQLEELYTLVPDEGVRSRFLEAVCTAADDWQDPVRVVFTLRDDFIGRLAGTPAARKVLERITLLRRLTPEVLSEVLRRPVAGAGYAFDDDCLVDDMVSQVAGEQAALPLLQFGALLLWERRDRVRRLVQRKSYESMGGLAGALAQHADEVFGRLTPDQVPLARELLLRLVTPAGTRRALTRRALVDGLGQDAEPVLQHLVASRLLHVRRSRRAGDSDAEIELAHESLIRTWSQLSRWIEESREDLAFLAELEQAADLWHRRGERDAELWRGDALVEARRHLERCTTRVPELLLRFHRRGETLARGAARRRRALIGGAFAGVLALAAGTLIAALTIAAGKREAEQQREDARLNGAIAELEGAQSALQRGDLLEARAKLRRSLEQQDTTHGRLLWSRLQAEPLVWDRAMDAFVYDVAFTPDGRILAAAGADRVVRLLDARNAALRQVLRGHESHVHAVTVSPDGSLVASGDRDGRVIVWRADGGKKVRTMDYDGAVRRLAFSRDGHTLLAVGDAPLLRAWDVAEGGVHIEVSLPAAARGIAVPPSGDTVALGCEDGRILSLRTTDGAVLRRARGSRLPIRSLAYSPDGRMLAAAGDDVTLWDGMSLEKMGTIHTGHVYSVAFGLGAKVLVTSSNRGDLAIWRAAPEGERMDALGTASEAGHALRVSPDGSLAALGGQDHLRLFRLGVPAELRAREDSGHSGDVYTVTVRPDGVEMASGGTDGTIRFWQAVSGLQLRTMEAHDGAVLSLAYGPDGHTLASSGNDGTIRLWDTASGGALWTRRAHAMPVWRIRWSGDGSLLASASEDGSVQIWDAGTGSSRAKLVPDPAAPLASVAWSPDGNRVAAGTFGGYVHVWEWPTGKHRFRALGPEGAGIRGVAFSPYGKLLAAGSTAAVWVLAEDLRLTRELAVDRMTFAVQFDERGERLTAAMADGTARVWDLRGSDAAEPVVFRHTQDVNDVTFFPGRSWVATASDDDTLRVWDGETGRPVWQAPALLSSPARLLSHTGWRTLHAGASAASIPAAAWMQALETEARQAVDWVAPGGTERLACMVTFDGRVELWDALRDSRLATRKAAASTRVAVGRSGCVWWGGGDAGLALRSGEVRVLGQAEAASVEAEGILLAAGRSVREFSAGGEPTGRELAVDVGVSALRRIGPLLAVGYREGEIDLYDWGSGRRMEGRNFENTPSSAPVRMLEGPRSTLLAGFESGLVGIWDLETGRRYYAAKLHGPVVHLVFEDERLHAATELGDSLSWDMSVLARERCEVLQDLWREVPVVWEGGQAVVQAPPAGLSCRRE